MNAETQTIETLYNAGHWLIGQDRHREALSLFRTMLLVDARDERGWLALATCHQALDETDKAITLCRLALTACEGRAPRCTIARARLHRALGDSDGAVEAYEQAAQIAEELQDDELIALVQAERGVS